MRKVSSPPCSTLSATAHMPPGGGSCLATRRSREKEILNKTIAKPRVLSEHGIGMLKARFPFLRSIRFKLTNEKRSMKRIIRYITTCVILHNLLLGFGDEYEVADEDLSTLNEENELNKALPSCPGCTDGRGEQLKNYILEQYYL